jgi:hypothetical protein
MPRAISPHSSEWVTGVQARQIIGCAASALQRAAMLGHIRVNLIPGHTPKYNRLDAERFAQARTQTTGAGVA